MSNLLSGTVAFVCTDLEGSTRRWDLHLLTMRRAIARHDALLRDAYDFLYGYIFKTVGEEMDTGASSQEQ